MSAGCPMEFGYWKIRGLGSIFRMIFEYKDPGLGCRVWGLGFRD